jgi:hypothetical protein
LATVLASREPPRRPAAVCRRRTSVGGERLWLVKTLKHSPTDVVAVFRAVAMTGDIERGTLGSVYFSDDCPRLDGGINTSLLFDNLW